MRYIIALFYVLTALFPLIARGEEPSVEWGHVKLTVACMRAEPRHGSELVSQVVMGTPLRLLDSDGSWWLVESPEGYRGYVIGNGMICKTETDMSHWRSARRGVVSSVAPGKVMSSADGHDVRDIVSDLIYTAIVEVGDTVGQSVAVTLPDGRNGYARLEDISLLEGKDEPDCERVVDTALGFMGMPYLWGGTTARGMDCSGLVKVCYLGENIILQRDASQQAANGIEIVPGETALSAGDLVFFGDPETGRINHVGIYDRDSCYVHSSGRVKRNSLNPLSPLYAADNRFVKAVRIVGAVGSEGITALLNHPWYF